MATWLMRLYETFGTFVENTLDGRLSTTPRCGPNPGRLASQAVLPRPATRGPPRHGGDLHVLAPIPIHASFRMRRARWISGDHRGSRIPFPGFPVHSSPTPTFAQGARQRGTEWCTTWPYVKAVSCEG